MVLTDGAGQEVWSGEVSPFGEKVEAEGAAAERLKYTGKELDPETGLYYFNARWYEPTLGRFTTEDPARDGANWYPYVLDIDHSSGKRLLATSQTGWRIVGETTKEVRYHVGLDVIPDGGSEDSIYAPEDGIFWFVNMGVNYGRIRFPSDLGFDVGSQLLNEMAGYRDDDYGFLTVLMTHPGDHARSRVYLFAHQGRPDLNVPPDKAKDVLEDEFHRRYGANLFPYAFWQEPPSSYFPVRAGDWIGVMSQRGTKGKHVHVEVFEYFPSVAGVEASHRWQRIDPRTVILPEWLDCSGADGAGRDLQRLFPVTREWVTVFPECQLPDPTRQ